MMNNSSKTTAQPQTKEELRELIILEVMQAGTQCDLNHIDVSLITDFSFLFFNSPYNGDISKWDTSRVETMRNMFEISEFNGDISRWDVSGVAYMAAMFYKSDFESDISNWNLLSVLSGIDIFLDSRIAKNLGVKSPSFEEVKSYFSGLKLEADLKDASPGQSQVSKVRL